MTVWGIDLGVRSFHAVGLVPGFGIPGGRAPEGSLSKFSLILATPKSVANQDPRERARELTQLGHGINPTPGIGISAGDQVFIEEPPLAGSKNLRTFLKLAQVSGVLGFGAHRSGAVVTYVPVSTWKKEVIGAGGASKDVVAAWLSAFYPAHSQSCLGDQNYVDATCLALYGRSVLRGAGSGGVDQPHPGLAVSR